LCLLFARREFENKKKFKEHLKKWKIKYIPWEYYNTTELDSEKYEELIVNYWKKIVIQIPESWLWKGTFFIDQQTEWNILVQQLKSKKIQWITISKYISGESASIICCNTKYWTLSTSIQKQIIDHPELINREQWDGIFCWHDRSSARYGNAIKEQTTQLGEKIGWKMYELWYKWIFGLDIIIEENSGDVFPIECNARFTGAFPMISLLDIQEKIIPMDAIHILEHANVPYTIDFNRLNKQYKRDKQWSHIVIRNTKKHTITLVKKLESGVYQIKRWLIQYQFPWDTYQEITNTNQIVITNRIAKIWDTISNFTWVSNICTILFPTSPHHIKEIIKFIYDHFS
jgi:hypothetical protein